MFFVVVESFAYPNVRLQAMLSAFEYGKQGNILEITSSLPDHLTIVLVCFSSSGDELFLCRQGCAGDCPSVVVRVPLDSCVDTTSSGYGFMYQHYSGGESHKTVDWNEDDAADDHEANTLAEFDFLMMRNKSSTSSAASVTSAKEKRQWWKDREKLDEDLGAYLENLEENWFGIWKVCLQLLVAPRY